MTNKTREKYVAMLVEFMTLEPTPENRKRREILKKLTYNVRYSCIPGADSIVEEATRIVANRQK